LLPKVLRSGRYVATVAVPWSTLVLLPHERYFVSVSRLPHIVRKGRTFVVVDLPVGTVLRVGRVPNAKYFLVDPEGLVQLKGVRAKILGLNMWGWHYVDPRTNERVVTVIYDGEKFVRYP
jgi:hypothetical protein